MPPVYADTSFLVSLYVQDANSGAAATAARGLLPFALTPIARHELRNAIRLCVFRRQITTAQRSTALEEIDADLSSGVLLATPVDWSKVLVRTEVLSREATEEIGARGMDIVHVAAALSLRCRRFATFDDRQAQLARRAGLEVVAPGRLR
ncbi:MAG: type II toxin-antitoxin system VapC family toxin [Opitutaceae bacterium]